MTYVNPNSALIIFAKAPIAGEVKTRLIPALGEVGAQTLYKRLLTQTLTIASNSNVAPIQLWINKDHPFLRECAERFNCTINIQNDSDLGGKMDHALTNVLKTTDKAVLIGTDCITLSEEYLLEAFTALNSNELVIGPASDGGYVLIGMKEAHPTLFSNITWSTDTVYTETLQASKLLLLSTYQLPIADDIDEPADLSKLDPRLLVGLDIKPNV